MINRYTLTADKETICLRFTADLSDHFRPRFNAAPSQLLPVLTSEHPQGFSWFYWGLPPERSRNKSIGERFLNLKAEDLLIKPVYRKSLMSHRCIIPADGFYFWRHLGKKTMVPYRVVLSGISLFGIAGLWEEFETETGEIQHTFTMITTSSLDSLSGFLDRMPLILTPEQEKIWIVAAHESEPKKILESKQGFSFEQYSVSPSIEHVGKDLPSMILHTPPADQFGNLTLFG